MMTTCMMAIDDKKLIVGSDTQNTIRGLRETVSRKFFECGDYVIAVAGEESVFYALENRWSFLSEACSDTSGIIDELMPRIREVLDTNGLLSKDESGLLTCNSSFLIEYFEDGMHKIRCVNPSLVLINETRDVAAIGTGGALALAAYNAVVRACPINRYLAVRLAIEAAIELDNGSGGKPCIEKYGGEV